MTLPFLTKEREGGKALSKIKNGEQLKNRNKRKKKSNIIRSKKKSLNQTTNNNQDRTFLGLKNPNKRKRNIAEGSSRSGAYSICVEKDNSGVSN